ncbi:hypothetical protein Q760_08530 [Cellulomonas cellasea DSM 20118]|uniref:Polyketide cyclase n=2 Tax=Cellulomonas cellasea TaxID=43670 RepID=A0A0A0BAM2_9CELL|nr:hypothetical protein Q760_08530 [Cellulomonas cellasea DSM 20118]GEA89808.1 hypothetical protein CCE01nite_37570 [Cellulomonas cellasea]
MNGSPGGPPPVSGAPRGREIAVSRVLPVSAEAAWDLLLEGRNHERWIPLTRIDLPDGPLRLGARFEATSGPFARRGAPGLLDRMRLDRFEPPTADRAGEAVFTKLGPILLGEAAVRVADAGPGRARVTWSERVVLAGPVPAGAVLAPVLGLMLRFALARIARELR